MSWQREKLFLTFTCSKKNYRYKSFFNTLILDIVRLDNWPAKAKQPLPNCAWNQSFPFSVYKLIHHIMYRSKAFTQSYYRTAKLPTSAAGTELPWHSCGVSSCKNSHPIRIGPFCGGKISTTAPTTVFHMKRRENEEML